MIPIDEQIEYMQSIVATSMLPTHMPKSILASLERLKKIDAVQVPDEPKCFEQYVWYYIKVSSGGVVQLSSKTLLEVLTYIDTLRDLLKRESARASEWEAEAGNQFQYAGRVLEQAHAAEAQRDACAQMNDDQASRVYEAEAKLAAIEKMGREPTKEMCKAGGSAISLNGGEGSDLEMESDAKEAFTAMFNKMMEELK